MFFFLTDGKFQSVKHIFSQCCTFFSVSQEISLTLTFPFEAKFQMKFFSVSQNKMPLILRPDVGRQIFLRKVKDGINFHYFPQKNLPPDIRAVTKRRLLLTDWKKTFSKTLQKLKNFRQSNKKFSVSQTKKFPSVKLKIFRQSN